jgi:hypothetical protein
VDGYPWLADEQRPDSGLKADGRILAGALLSWKWFILEWFKSPCTAAPFEKKSSGFLSAFAV